MWCPLFCLLLRPLLPRPQASDMDITRIDLSPVGGVAGDMFAAALLDALPQLREPARADIACLGIEGLSAVTVSTTSASLRALHFQVTQPASPKPPRTLAAVAQFLLNSALETQVRGVALGIYELLAQAEATVHNKTIDTIHFHEVSDWDSMVDIVTAAGIIARLPGVTWRLGALPLGGGTIKTAHGDIPVPAPATVELLRGFEWIDDGVAGERVTPTGAAILKYLAPQATRTVLPAATLFAVGSGAGTRQLPGRANVLRATVFAGAGNANDQLIEQLAFEVDDMTAEEIAAATDYLRLLPGVADVCTLALTGKKGRIATGLRLLVQPDQAETVITDCFMQTTTLGVRRGQLMRRVLPRDERMVADVRVKVAERPRERFSAKAASDDLGRADNLYERRELAAGAESAALDRQGSHDGGGKPGGTVR